MRRVTGRPAVAAEGVIEVRAALLQALLRRGDCTRDDDLARLDGDLVRAVSDSVRSSRSPPYQFGYRT